MPWAKPLTTPDDQFLGKSLEQAREMARECDLTIRVTDVDGQGCIVTCDYNTRRVNVCVVDGIITEVGRRG